jgi:outer membrane protein TolC
MKHLLKGLLVLAPLTMTACHPPERDVSVASGRPLALPPGLGATADKAQVVPETSALPPVFAVPPDAALPRRGDEIPIDTAHAYSLPELIDLAQRLNPETRIAWERARQAALAVGVVESSYLPELSAEILGGYQHTPLPIPKSLDSRGYFTANTEELVPGLVVKWLLFDFGRRDALADAAKQISAAADVGFTGAHQKLIFEVSKAYFAVDAQRAQLRVAKTALTNAQLLEEAVLAKRERGLATVPEVAMARRSTAKAVFELEQAKAADNDVYHALLEAMGITPTLKLTLADSSGRRLPQNLAGTADGLVQRALARRPDIVASLAKLRAGEAGVVAAEATYYPSLGLEGSVNRNIGSVTINGGPSYRVDEPAAGVLFRLKLPLYDGGLRDKGLEIARSQRRTAEAELAKAQDQAIRQIARTRDELTSALALHAAALSLEDAADVAADAALDAYQHGVGTFTAASTAATERAQAQSARARAYAGVLTTAAALAFVTGELTSSDALESPR